MKSILLTCHLFAASAFCFSLLTGCAIDNYGNGRYAFRIKSPQELRAEQVLKQKAVDYSTRTASAPSLAGKDYKIFPSSWTYKAIVQFHPGGSLTYDETSYKGLKGKKGEWKQDGNAIAFQLSGPVTVTYIARVTGERMQGVFSADNGRHGEFSGITGTLLAEHVRKEDAEGRRQLARIKSAWDSFASSGNSGVGSSDGFQMYGYNNMTVVYDKLAGESPRSGTNTIHATSGGRKYSLTYNFHPGAYLLDGGGDLTGDTIRVKFEGRPVSASNDLRGTGFVKIIAWQEL